MYTQIKQQIKQDLSNKRKWGEIYGKFSIIKAQLKSFAESGNSTKPNEFELIVLLVCKYFKPINKKSDEH